MIIYFGLSGIFLFNIGYRGIVINSVFFYFSKCFFWKIDDIDYFSDYIYFVFVFLVLEWESSVIKVVYYFVCFFAMFMK